MHHVWCLPCLVWISRVPDEIPDQTGDCVGGPPHTYHCCLMEAAPQVIACLFPYSAIHIHGVVVVCVEVIALALISLVW